MKIYLVWERESYCEYDVVFISFNKNKAQQSVENRNKEYGYERFTISEHDLDKIENIEW